MAAVPNLDVARSNLGRNEAACLFARGRCGGNLEYDLIDVLAHRKLAPFFFHALPCMEHMFLVYSIFNCERRCVPRAASKPLAALVARGDVCHAQLPGC